MSKEYSMSTSTPTSTPTSGEPAVTLNITAQHSMSACDKLTMETMMNVDAYSKYMNRRSQAAESRNCPDNSERKFYKRRIIDTTKEMLRNSKHVNDVAVTNTFNAYINACIMHYKFIDLADTIQGEYSGLSVEPSSTTSTVVVSEPEPPEAAAAAVMKMNKLCFNPKVEESKTVQIRTPHMNAIERLFVSKPIQSEVEQTRDQIKEPETDKNVNNVNNVNTDKKNEPASPTNKMSAIPRTKDINIKDEQFKTKGIKPKLKNKADSSKSDSLPNP